MLDQYLKENNKLDYQKLYHTMQSFKGAAAKQRGECLYQEVISAYEEFKQTGLPTTVEKLESYVAEGSIGSSTNPHLFPKGDLPSEKEGVFFLKAIFPPKKR